MFLKSRGKDRRIYLSFRFNYRQYYLPTNYYCTLAGDDKNCKCKSHKSARALSLEIKRKINENTFILSDYFPRSNIRTNIDVSKNVLFETYATQFLSLKSKTVAYSTYLSLCVKIKHLIAYFKNLKLADIKMLHIKKYVADFNTMRSIRGRIGTLHQIFESAIQDEIISKNPCEKIKLPRFKKQEIKILNIADVKQFLDYCDQHFAKYTIFFALGFLTGMRTGEIFALQWADIDEINHKITVSKTVTTGRLKLSTKTNETRIIDIIPALDAYINKQKYITYLQQSFVLLTHKNTFFKSPLVLTRIFKKILVALGLPKVKMYAMRHSFACNMISAGEPLKWIAEMLGHTDLSMLTKIYGNWIKRSDNERAGLKFGMEF